MSSIPLPALHIQQYQAPDLIGQQGNLMRLQAMQQQMANAPLQRQALEQEVQSGAVDVQQKQQALKDGQTFRAYASDPKNHGQTLGEMADGLGHQGAISQQTWMGMKKADTEAKQATANLSDTEFKAAEAGNKQLFQLYDSVQNMPDDQLAANWGNIAQQYDSIVANMPKTGQQPMPTLNPNQPMSKQALSQFGPMISMGSAYLDKDAARRKAQADLQTSQATLSGKQAENSFYSQNGGAPGVPVEAQQQADWLKKNPGKGPSDFVAWKAKQSPYGAVMVTNLLGGPQNQQGLDFAADNYRKTGQLPSFSYRSPATGKAILDRAAQMDQEQGGGGIATNKAILQANTKSLDNVQKQFDTVNAFENTAGKNIDMALQKAAAIPDLGGRFANTPVRMINEKMLGTRQMAEFKAALATAQTESAKVLNSANASGVLSDTARRELEDITSGNLSLNAMKGQWGVIKQDMQNRHDSYQQQIGDIQTRIKGAGSATTQQTGGSTPQIGDIKKFPNGRTGKWDGQGYVAQ